VEVAGPGRDGQELYNGIPMGIIKKKIYDPRCQICFVKECHWDL
jgi:hypothetical protein